MQSIKAGDQVFTFVNLYGDQKTFKPPQRVYGIRSGKRPLPSTRTVSVRLHPSRLNTASITTWSSIACSRQSGTDPSISFRSPFSQCSCLKWIQDTEFALSTIKNIRLLPNDFWMSLLNLGPLYSKSPGKLSQ